MIWMCNLDQRVGPLTHRESGQLGGTVLGDDGPGVVARRRHDRPLWERSDNAGHRLPGDLDRGPQADEGTRIGPQVGSGDEVFMAPHA